jgi:hypothetical protein
MLLGEYTGRNISSRFVLLDFALQEFADGLVNKLNSISAHL